MDGFDNVLTF